MPGILSNRNIFQACRKSVSSFATQKIVGTLRLAAMGILWRIGKAIAVLASVPLLGILIALILGALALPPDPNPVVNGVVNRAPGDGFLAMGLLLMSLVISVPLAIALAWKVASRKPAVNPLQDQLPTTEKQ